MRRTVVGIRLAGDHLLERGERQSGHTYPARMADDLATRHDVIALVTAFYRRAFADETIGPIFTDVAQMDLAHHLPVITDFWETVLFNAGTYRRKMLAIHVALNARVALQEAHFARWLELWTATVDERFAGPKAELAKAQARRIAGSLDRRLHGRSGSEFETVLRRTEFERLGFGDGSSAHERAEGEHADQHQQYHLDEFEGDVPEVHGVPRHRIRGPAGDDATVHPTAEHQRTDCQHDAEGHDEGERHHARGEERRHEQHDGEHALGDVQRPEHEAPDADPERHGDAGGPELQRRLEERDGQHHP